MDINKLKIAKKLGYTHVYTGDKYLELKVCPFLKYDKDSNEYQSHGDSYYPGKELDEQLVAKRIEHVLKELEVKEDIISEPRDEDIIPKGAIPIRDVINELVNEGWQLTFVSDRVILERGPEKESKPLYVSQDIITIGGQVFQRKHLELIMGITMLNKQ